MYSENCTTESANLFWFIYFQHGERVEFLCRCSFLEIYNEQIFDLLDPASTGLSLREDIKKGVFVDGLLERDVASARDAYRVFTVFYISISITTKWRTPTLKFLSFCVIVTIPYSWNTEHEYIELITKLTQDWHWKKVFLNYILVYIFSSLRC